MEDKKGIWQGGTTKVESKMSEEEARFWRGFEDYNDNVGLDSDFSAEYVIEKEMRMDYNDVPLNKKPEISGGNPILKRNESKPEVSK